MSSLSRPERRARRLFWLQVGVGLVGGIVLFGTVLASLSAGPWWAYAAVLALVCLGVLVGALLALERRKPFAEDVPDVPEWAQRVADLRTSRREIVAAFELERRRIERDLHDGAQQHLVTAGMKLGEAAMLVEQQAGTSPGHDHAPDDDAATPGADRLAEAARLLSAAQDDADRALAALRETVSGIHPTVLSDRGLEAAVRELAERAVVPVTVQVPHALPALPEGVAAVAYFVVSEALTNVVKYAPDASVTVLLVVDDALHVSIVDDGPGGAEIVPGRGLAGMSERLGRVS
ncbi:sensor histidine kinase [Georgenia sp. Z1344]|uniref:sensor histidine kinase n=1 Tax=Georgenia sp. Z1344 TaxID=3416706 RepID=UPI003CF8D20E